MNNKYKIIGIALLAILAVTAVGVGVAYAQTPTPGGYGPGWMMGGYTQNDAGYGMMGRRGGMMSGYAQAGQGSEWMQSMHAWMTASGGMHTVIWEALAEKLGFTSDELSAAVSSGKTLAQIGEENGVSREDLLAVLETAHQDSLAQAVSDGYLTQEQADAMLAQMAGRYQWMLDNSAPGMMNGAYGRQGGNGAFGPGSCHGNWDGSAAGQPTQP